jgi:hypothetical protein
MSFIPGKVTRKRKRIVKHDEELLEDGKAPEVKIAKIAEDREQEKEVELLEEGKAPEVKIAKITEVCEQEKEFEILEEGKAPEVKIAKIAEYREPEKEVELLKNRETVNGVEIGVQSQNLDVEIVQPGIEIDLDADLDADLDKKVEKDEIDADESAYLEEEERKFAEEKKIDEKTLEELELEELEELKKDEDIHRLDCFLPNDKEVKRRMEERNIAECNMFDNLFGRKEQESILIQKNKRCCIM